jgi:hypothetical protein
MSQILTMFQVYPVLLIYLVSRDVTTIATVGFVDPAAGSLEKKDAQGFSKRVTLSCLALPSPSLHVVTWALLGRPAPQRFGDHSLADFATPRYRTLPVGPRTASPRACRTRIATGAFGKWYFAKLSRDYRC